MSEYELGQSQWLFKEECEEGEKEEGEKEEGEKGDAEKIIEDAEGK